MFCCRNSDVRHRSDRGDMLQEDGMETVTLCVQSTKLCSSCVWSNEYFAVFISVLLFKDVCTHPVPIAAANACCPVHATLCGSYYCSTSQQSLLHSTLPTTNVGLLLAPTSLHNTIYKTTRRIVTPFHSHSLITRCAMATSSSPPPPTAEVLPGKHDAYNGIQVAPESLPHDAVEFSDRLRHSLEV